MKSKISLFAFSFLVAACNTAPKSNPETSIKKELKPEQKLTATENFQSSQKEPNPELEMEILSKRMFILPGGSIDSTNEYGAGVSFPEIRTV